MSYPAPPDPSLMAGGVWIKVGPVGGTWVHSLRLPVNPDEEVQYDARVTLIQTITGAYFDDYGLGVPRLTLTGNTAWMSPKGLFNGVQVNGMQAAQHLYRDILLFYFQQERGHTTPSSMEMAVFDDAGGYAWRVKPLPPPLATTRSKSDPLVVHYTAVFAVEQDLLSDSASPAQKTPDPVQQALSKATSAPSANKPPLTAQNQKTQAASRRTAQTYTVQSGDTLWSIATSLYGQGTLWSRIWQANKRVVPIPNDMQVGITLVIPPGPNANQSAASAAAIH